MKLLNVLGSSIVAVSLMAAPAVFAAEPMKKHGDVKQIWTRS